MISFRSSLSKRAVTLLESLTVIVILGIVIFVTLPHLTNSKANADLAAIKAKANQLNIAKDSYVSLVGVEQAQTNWSAAADDEARFQLIKGLIAPATTASTLNGVNAVTCFSVPGYILVFSPNNNDTNNPPSSPEKVVGYPVLIYQDSNLDGAYNLTEPSLPY